MNSFRSGDDGSHDKQADPYIEIDSAMLKMDFRKSGRIVDKLGLSGLNSDEIINLANG